MLSKWVGEAEKQLRLLFEAATRMQPSIIFFDEIDGLAPVRSSKQDYIHASIVSTLLALMDGLDNRGQVIVIGATNRPDHLDPALRRPGRASFGVWIFSTTSPSSSATRSSLQACRELLVAEELGLVVEKIQTPKEARPGRRRAGSRWSGRFVAPMTMTCPRLSRPSMSASSVETIDAWM